MFPVSLASRIVKSGKINISANKEKLIDIRIEDKNIDLDIIDHNFVKEFIEDASKVKFFREHLKNLRILAEELKDEKVTISVSYQNTPILIIGSDAKARFTRIFTGTKDITIKNLQKIIQLSFF